MEDHRCVIVCVSPVGCSNLPRFRHVTKNITRDGRVVHMFLVTFILFISDWFGVSPWNL